MKPTLDMVDAVDFAAVHSAMNEGTFAGSLSGAALWAMVELTPCDAIRSADCAFEADVSQSGARQG